MRLENVRAGELAKAQMWVMEGYAAHVSRAQSPSFHQRIA